MSPAEKTDELVGVELAEMLAYWALRAYRRDSVEQMFASIEQNAFALAVSKFDREVGR